MTYSNTYIIIHIFLFMAVHGMPFEPKSVLLEAKGFNWQKRVSSMMINLIIFGDLGIPCASLILQHL